MDFLYKARSNNVSIEGFVSNKFNYGIKVRDRLSALIPDNNNVTDSTVARLEYHRKAVNAIASTNIETKVYNNV